MIEAVLFDYGGVVLFHDPADYDSVGRQYGFESAVLWAALHGIAEYQPSRTGAISSDEFHAAVRRHLLDSASAENVDAALASITEYYKSQAPVRPVMRDVLVALRGRVRLGLLSNATKGATEGLLRNGVGGLFDVLLCSGDIGVAKPEPAAYHFALNRLGVAAEQCLFADDSGEHVSAAARVGLVATQYHHTRHDDFLGLLHSYGLPVPR